MSDYDEMFPPKFSENLKKAMSLIQSDDVQAVFKRMDMDVHQFVKFVQMFKTVRELPVFDPDKPPGPGDQFITLLPVEINGTSKGMAMAVVEIGEDRSRKTTPLFVSVDQSWDIKCLLTNQYSSRDGGSGSIQ